MTEKEFSAWWYDFCVKNQIGDLGALRTREVAWQAYKAGYAQRKKEAGEDD